MEERKEWQVVELLKKTADFFIEKQVDEARLTAELLLGRVIGKSRLELYLHYSRPVYEDELERFRQLCRQRLEGRPVQYILEEQCFYGLDYSVDERVLIPRPETELLVEYALELLGFSGRGGRGEANILDIGTGSGCIAVTMAKLCPSLHATAVDCSLDALAVARCNAARHGVESRITFVMADMLDDCFSERITTGPFDLILSNPPYIPEVEWATLQREVREYEPKLALTTPDGFECYRAVAGQAGKLLTAGGKLFFELHADAAPLVSEIMTANGFASIKVHKDYSGHDRVISGSYGG
ncbi:MAG: peptide chain release factor N(5)-glutamine methyltransferase [Chlorobiaceae bacterium]|nr:peptide chain release factor N(5)-glutamine methyltransferase [Chlorobiaceae bacterium]